MSWRLLIKGLVVGLSIAAPVGPIGVLCIRRTLDRGRLSGLVSGLGAASADMVYGSVAGLGLTLISDFLVDQQRWLPLVGGAFLLYLGVKTLLAKPGEQALEVEGKGLLGMYASTFLLTLTNPMTILSFAAVFAGLGLAEAERRGAATLVAGVFMGSALWWLTLSGIVSLVRHRVSGSTMLWINRISGLLIGGFGVAALLSAAG
jgi:threonine/homoserine/homoserine lactone efflux protein